jgi:hypothetical protein
LQAQDEDVGILQSDEVNWVHGRHGGPNLDATGKNFCSRMAQPPEFEVHLESIRRKYVDQPSSAEIERRQPIEGELNSCYQLI